MIKRILQILGVLVLLLALLVGGVLVFVPVNFTAVFNVMFGYSIAAPSQDTITQRLKVPEGFSIGLYASGLKKVRLMEFSRSGDLLASQPREGKVVLLKRDAESDGRHNGQVTLLQGLNAPHGIAFYQDWLYIAEKDAVGRVKFDHQSGKLAGDYQRIITELPADGNHWSKSIRIRDDKLYVSIGSSCNVCIEADQRRATVMIFDVDGSNGRIYADGLRNSVGLDFAPWDGSLYATDNGRDLLGDDYPVCELNKIEDKAFYGWPYINAFGDLDPEFGTGQEAKLADDKEPVFGFAAHNAPLGMRFIRQAKVPAGYQRTALVALHGSWNRSSADGYKVVALHWDADGKISSEDFFTGFEKGGDIIGRPVDIAEGPDGCIYVSDDFSGSIYRVCYGVAQNTLTATAEPSSEDTVLANLSSAEKKALNLQGAELYAANNCQLCHQLNGQGAAAGKALKGLAKRYSVTELQDYFLLPNPPMPKYPLAAEQRQALAVYLLDVAQ